MDRKIQNPTYKSNTWDTYKLPDFDGFDQETSEMA